jgi:hypothetical protein
MMQHSTSNCMNIFFIWISMLSATIRLSLN